MNAGSLFNPIYTPIHHPLPPRRYKATLISQFAKGNRRAVGKDPECRMHGLRQRKEEGVDAVCAVLHVVEGGGTVITVEQNADAARVGVGQHCLAAVVPRRKLDVKPLDAPGLGVTAQATGRTFPIDGRVRQTQAAEVIAAHFDLPVMSAPRKALTAEHLGERNRK